MFGYNDKFSLVGTNAIDKEGRMLNYILPFPIREDKFDVPENLAMISILEYHEEETTYGKEAFKILVGKTISVKEICELNKKNIIYNNRVFESVNSSDDRLCYSYGLGGELIIFAKINPGDIVVKDINELKNTLLSISKKTQNIKKSISTIKDNTLDKENETLLKEDKIKSALKFYLLATKLKYKIRSGWDQKHWNIASDRLESIAEHVYGTCILAISLDSEFKLNMDMEKVLKMLTIHEIGEVLIGDITPFDKISEEEKAKIEHKAMKDVLGDLASKDELFNLLIEFDEHNTKESKFAYLCDKMEADIQAKVYQDKGYQHSLDDQENNVVFKNPKIGKMIDDGAKEAFDIWYEWDKSKFTDEPVFIKTLSYIKKHNTNI